MSPRIPLVALSAVLFATACADAPKTEVVPGAPAAFVGNSGAAAAIPVVTVTARDFNFAAPEQLMAGVTTFSLVNDGALPHHVQLVRFSAGKTLTDYLAALKAGGPPPSWATEVGGPNAVGPKSEANATLTLEPGDYGLVCFVNVPDGVPHLMKGMARALRVTPRPAGAPAPLAPIPDVTMALKDYNFTVTGTLKPGRRVIQVENAGPQVHEVELFRIPPGQTMESLQRYLDTGMQGPPPAEALGGVAGIAPGATSSFSVDLSAGNYALVCFIPDSKDGKPHFMHGMIQQLTVA